MSWTSWGLLLLVGLVAGAAGACCYACGPALLRAAAPHRRRLVQRLRALRRQRPAPPPVCSRRQEPASEDALVLMPDGRPWPLGPAVKVLELAWRWQVVHGAVLPFRARHGEGAYVWRPPLPRASSERSAEAES
ncbi:MAG TPA: hypothetical protein PLJ35_13645 [Anaerolineae bacterium]|nr:hypothetical protein [Anaerolineae bacterium]HOQ99858.1 hypothetical protein [Anaerolineae bacterium]HPL28215.1 hypothetical protein [Anaerolineae bacterium]